MGVVLQALAGLGHAVIQNPLCTWERWDGSRRNLADAFCIALYAGAEAERIIFGIEPFGDDTDQDRATNCLALIGVLGASVSEIGYGNGTR